MAASNVHRSGLSLALSALVGTSLVLPNTGCGGSSEPPTEVTVRVTEFVALSDLEDPMPGAEVCETDTNNCVRTDETGLATIELPSDSEVSYTITKEGYGSYLVSDVTNADLEHWFWMYTEEELARLSQLMGTTYPWTDSGIVLLRVYNGVNNEPGVMFDLVGESNNQFYFVNGDTPSTGIDATTQDGRGGFTDVTAGEYQVEFRNAQIPCRAFTAWPGDMDNRVRVPVKAGYISYSSMSCGTAPVP